MKEIRPDWKPLNTAPRNGEVFTVWCNNDCTRQIMFSWASDSSVINNPGWTIANVKLTYNL